MTQNKRRMKKNYKKIHHPKQKPHDLERLTTSDQELLRGRGQMDLPITEVGNQAGSGTLNLNVEIFRWAQDRATSWKMCKQKRLFKKFQKHFVLGVTLSLFIGSPVCVDIVIWYCFVPYSCIFR